MQRCTTNCNETLNEECCREPSAADLNCLVSFLSRGFRFRPAVAISAALAISALVYAVVFALFMRPPGAMVMPEWREGFRFAVEQIRPFSAFFGNGTAAQEAFDERAPLWLAAIAVLQSLSIYGFLALFFLALRWRFKRD